MMAVAVDATAFLPEQVSLESLRRAASDCHGCDLWHGATQTVFGEGPQDARMMLVGEAPGDREDREGHPFVGPAGRELDKALTAVGIDRSEVYVTNAVKHFKFEERGKRRIHQRPDAKQIKACSHGRHALICLASGRWWMRRLPRSSNLKCLTAFVT